MTQATTSQTSRAESHRRTPARSAVKFGFHEVQGGVAAGPSGMTVEHLKPMLETEVDNRHLFEVAVFSWEARVQLETRNPHCRTRDASAWIPVGHPDFVQFAVGVTFVVLRSCAS